MRRREEEAADSEGQERPSDATLKKQCQTEYDTLKTEVMQFLIQAEWVQQEAEEQDVKVSDSGRSSSPSRDQKKQAFPTDKAYQEFLKTSGMSEEDILSASSSTSSSRS